MPCYELGSNVMISMNKEDNWAPHKTKFTSRFLKDFFAGLGIEFSFSKMYQPKWMEKQRGKIQSLRILRMYVTYHPNKWEEYLPLVEFSYNNGYKNL